MATSLLQSLSSYSRMIKLSHSLFALPFAGLSAILAILVSTDSNRILLWKSLWIIICMVSARSAAMGFNRYVDRDIDKQNPRTANREIPAGQVSEKNALFFILVSAIIFLAASAMISWLCFGLAFPALFLILFYSYSKRFTFLCHFILGAAIGVAPLAAWLAILNRLETMPIFWSLGLMFHIAGFDILYSIQDVEFDNQQGLHSIPSRFGVGFALILARILHILCFLFLFLAGFLAGLGIYYYIFLFITGILFILEHRMVSLEDLSKIPIAFFHINASISAVLFFGILIDKWADLLRRLNL